MTQTDGTDVIWLTQSQYDALQDELAELRGPARAAVVEKVSEARDEGDLKENGGYHAAREELGKIDGRIAQLEQMLKKAQVGETPPDDGVVEPGMIVTIRFEDDTDTEQFLLGAREMMGSEVDMEVYSPQSPMGTAINGHRKGETVEYKAPNGNVLRVELIDAVPFKN